MTTTVKKILKTIGNDKLDLYRVTGDAYHVFEYFDLENGIYETSSVMVPFLSHMNFDQWVSEGKTFVERVAV